MEAEGQGDAKEKQKAQIELGLTQNEKHGAEPSENDRREFVDRPKKANPRNGFHDVKEQA